MKNARTVGYTGFVGSNLCQQSSFEGLYNSKNFREMSHLEFGTVVCAGISAVKWQANQNPDQDWSAISQLQDVLRSVSADRFVLISTIDVYPVIQGKNESFDCHQQSNHAYGTHRLRFEDFCRDRFRRCTIVRLPGLFGTKLRKNVIYDLLNENCLESINSASSFQYYCLDRLWNDISRVIDAGIATVNLFTEPIATSDIHQRFFPHRLIGSNPAPEAHYDLHTMHAGLWGKQGPYMMSADEVLSDLERFVRNYPTRGVAE